jgi:hypothetical protein
MKKYNVDDNFFNSIDNQYNAWLLGLLYADGCVYENGTIKIDLVKDDIDVLEKIKEIIKCDAPLHEYEQGKKKFTGNEKIYDCKAQCRLVWHSQKMKDDLIKLGCVSNKTYILKFPTEEIVPNEYIKDFIRGYLDGDGGISYWIDNQNTGHKKFSIYACGTTEMMEGITNIIQNKFNCKPTIHARYENRDNNNKQIMIDGNRKVLEILEWLYKDADVYMDRKYKKYLELKEEIKRVDNDKNLYGFLKPRKQVIRLSDLTIYDSCAECSRQNKVSKSFVTVSCQKKNNNFMYLEDYRKDHENGIR